MLFVHAFWLVWACFELVLSWFRAGSELVLSCLSFGHAGAGERSQNRQGQATSPCRFCDRCFALLVILCRFSFKTLGVSTGAPAYFCKSTEERSQNRGGWSLDLGDFVIVRQLFGRRVRRPSRTAQNQLKISPKPA